MNTLVEFKNIKKNFYSNKGEVKVLDDISFNVHEEEIVVILGPSGCGKSTILNITSELESISDGEIKINTTLGYMFQKDNLMNWRDVFDNVMLGLEVKKEKTPENIKYTKSLLKKYNLEEFKYYYPHELSGGMRQRVALIRTLALKPGLLMLDEPFSALDSQTRLFVQNDVYNIIRSEKKAAIIVTHDISEAIALGDKILILSDRPCIIKKVINLEFEQNLSPKERRKDSRFTKYFNQIYKELDHYEKR